LNSKPDDRHKMRKSKMTDELHKDVLIFDHTGLVRRLESMEQKAAVSWFRFEFPHLFKSLVHVPNETQGTASYQRGLTEMGRVTGCSDLILLLPSRGYPYVVIEMKTKKGTATEEQVSFMNHHAKQGALCAICRGKEAFQRFIKYYLQYE
jgi:hypothetical protein